MTRVNTHLQTLGTVDGTQGSQHSKYSKNLDDADGVRLEHERDERHGDDQNIQQVEGVATEAALVPHQTVHYHFQCNLHRKHRREEVVEIVQHLEESMLSSTDI